ncbi:MAG: hypothetical protein PHC33_05120 [Candidatus Omnitrophica bacterium]|nr:hypothetical protein [Candidatus Omnitrophota bacterium]
MCGLSVVKGVCAFVPAVVLLTVSFFVLVVARKTEGETLKGFGYVVAVFLWIAAAFTLSAGLFIAVSGQKFFNPASFYMMGPSGMSDMRRNRSDCSLMEKINKERQERQTAERMMSK